MEDSNSAPTHENQPIPGAPLAQGQNQTTTNETQIKKSKSNFPIPIPVLILLLIPLILLIIFVCYFGLNLVKSYFLTPSTQTETTTEKTTSTPTLDPISDWKTYEREGFSIKYPNNKLIRVTCLNSWKDELHLSKRDKGENNDSIELLACGRGGGVHEAIEIITTTNNNEAVEEDGTRTSDNLIITTKTITINGVQAKKSITRKDLNIEEGPPFPNFLEIVKVPYGENDIIFTLADESLQKEFDQILSTFKFTDMSEMSSVDTSDWKTYESKLEGLSFKYPNDWNEKKEATDNYEELTLTTKSGYEFNFISSQRYRDGGCTDCTVHYSEKVSVPKFKDLFILENDRSANANVIYLAENNIPVGEDGLNWFIASKKYPDKRDIVFQGEFWNKDHMNIKMDPKEFSETPEVQATREILKSVTY